MSVYEQLEAATLPLIEAYREDLTKHDRSAIEESPDLPFLHWTRSTGTHIVFLQGDDTLPAEGERVKYLFGTADRVHIVRQVVEMARSFTRPNDPPSSAVHYFDGRKLHAITAARAVEIAEQYRRSMFESWERVA